MDNRPPHLHLTGRVRARIDWRGRLIMQVQLCEPKDGWIGPRMTQFGMVGGPVKERKTDDPYEFGADLWWRDATPQDLSEINLMQAQAPVRWMEERK